MYSRKGWPLVLMLISILAWTPLALASSLSLEVSNVEIRSTVNWLGATWNQLADSSGSAFSGNAGYPQEQGVGVVYGSDSSRATFVGASASPPRQYLNLMDSGNSWDQASYRVTMDGKLVGTGPQPTQTDHGYLNQEVNSGISINTQVEGFNLGGPGPGGFSVDFFASGSYQAHLAQSGPYQFTSAQWYASFNGGLLYTILDTTIYPQGDYQVDSFFDVFLGSSSGSVTWQPMDPSDPLNSVWYGNGGDLTGFNLSLGQHGTVPVPGAFWLMASGLAGLAGFSFRRRNL